MQSNRISTLVLWIVVVFVMGIVAGPTPAAATHGVGFFDDFSSDINLRFNVLGDTLSLKAWAHGTPEPVMPQLMVTGVTPFTESDITITRLESC